MMVKVAYQDPAIYEMVGLLGFDCVWICNEHIGIDPALEDEMLDISAAIRNRLTLIRMKRVLEFE